MRAAQPSLTARRAAAHRVAHQALEGGVVFTDPLAGAILGEDAEAVTEAARADPSQRPMRLFVAARSRVAEDAVAAAVDRGVRQAVVLGAGLDTFALRNPHGDAGLLVWEVDHPSRRRGSASAWRRPGSRSRRGCPSRRWTSSGRRWAPGWPLRASGPAARRSSSGWASSRT